MKQDYIIMIIIFFGVNYMALAAFHEPVIEFMKDHKYLGLLLLVPGVPAILVFIFACGMIAMIPLTPVLMILYGMAIAINALFEKGSHENEIK